MGIELSRCDGWLPELTSKSRPSTILETRFILLRRLPVELIRPILFDAGFHRRFSSELSQKLTITSREGPTQVTILQSPVVQGPSHESRPVRRIGWRIFYRPSPPSGPSPSTVDPETELQKASRDTWIDIVKLNHGLPDASSAMLLLSLDPPGAYRLAGITRENETILVDREDGDFHFHATMIWHPSHRVVRELREGDQLALVAQVRGAGETSFLIREAECWLECAV